MKVSKQPQEKMKGQIISKFSRFKFIRGLFLAAFLGIVVLLVTACAGSVSLMAGAVPTVTVTPSETPPPVATLSPTATPDTFADLKVCTDWKKPCPATEQDLMSGRLINFAKSVGKPFPKEAYNTGQMSFGYSYYGTKIGFDWNNIKGQPSHPEQELYRKKGSLIVPYRWMMHFWVPYNGITYQISIQQWLNTDASVSYLQYIIDRKDAVYKNGMSPSKTLFEQVGEVMPVCEVNGALNFGNTLFGLSYNDQERADLIKEWEKTGVIPEQLQYKILLSDIVVNDRTKKLP